MSAKSTVVFFGTPDIAFLAFEKLVKCQEYEVLALVTAPARPKGRGHKVEDTRIKKLAIEHDITVFEPEKLSRSSETVAALRNLAPDFFVTFAFGQILSQEVLDIPKYHTINLHASLLPKYRGADPIRAALLNGDETTGITTMVTVYNLDEGDTLLFQKIPLTQNTNAIELTEQVAKLAPVLIVETLDKLLTRELVPKPQDSVGVSYVRKIEKEAREIYWGENANCLHNKIRAFAGNLDARSRFKGKIIKFLKSSVVEYVSAGDLGIVMDISKKGILVRCGTDALLITELKPEGKPIMSAWDWSLGADIQKGDAFENTGS
jgi:methionyl-tRNA formyltransferase